MQKCSKTNYIYYYLYIIRKKTICFINSKLFFAGNPILVADAVTSRRSRDTAKSNMLAVGVMVAMARVEVAMVVVVVVVLSRWIKQQNCTQLWAESFIYVCWGPGAYLSTNVTRKQTFVDAVDESICILLRSYQVIINFKVIVSRDCPGMQMILMDRA